MLLLFNVTQISFRCRRREIASVDVFGSYMSSATSGSLPNSDLKERKCEFSIRGSMFTTKVLSIFLANTFYKIQQFTKVQFSVTDVWMTLLLNVGSPVQQCFDKIFQLFEQFLGFWKWIFPPPPGSGFEPAWCKAGTPWTGWTQPVCRRGPLRRSWWSP